MDRQRLLAVERLIVELICFNFTSHMPFAYVIKVGRKLKGLILHSLQMRTLSDGKWQLQRRKS